MWNYVGTPQGSAPRLLLFDIDLVHLFLESKDDNIDSLADKTTPCSCAEDLLSPVTEFQRIARKRIQVVWRQLWNLILESII